MLKIKFGSLVCPIEQSIDWEEKIKFRNILISNPHIVIEYGELKKKLILRHQDNRSEYTKAKSQFIRKIIGK